MLYRSALLQSWRLLAATAVCGLAIPLPVANASLVWKLETIDGLFTGTFVLDPTSPEFVPGGAIDTFGFGIESISFDDGTGFAIPGPLHSSPLELGPNPSDPAGAYTAGLLQGEDHWKRLDITPLGDPAYPFHVSLRLDVRPPGFPPAGGPPPPGGVEAFERRFGGHSYSSPAKFTAIPEPASIAVWSVLGITAGVAVLRRRP